jgi:hypothetical protein
MPTTDDQKNFKFIIRWSNTDYNVFSGGSVLKPNSQTCVPEIPAPPNHPDVNVSIDITR